MVRAAARGAGDGPEGERAVQVTAVADTFVDLMRAFGRTKARFLAAAAHDVEWSAQMVLKYLAVEGPTRASAIAENLQSDPSTVSRQIAALVKDGLVERRADPEDRRASILVLTAKADAVLAAYEELRIRRFAGMLSDWNERDLRSFAALLCRFTDDFEKTSNCVISERTASRRHSAERKI